MPEKKPVKQTEKKKKRQPSAYALFVKATYDSVRNLEPKMRFKAIAKLWKEEKAKKGE
jgi:hypothetical protein